MMSALPVYAEPELYFGDVKTLEDGSKIVSLMVKDVNDLGSSDAIIEFTPSEGVRVTDVTSGDGNALILQAKDIDNTAGVVQITAWDVGTAHSGDVVICNIAYTGSDSNPFEIGPAELFDYTYNKIPHSGKNDIDRSTVNPTATKVADVEGIVAESTEIADETNGSSGEDNKGIPGFGLLTCLSVKLIAVRLLREDK